MDKVFRGSRSACFFSIVLRVDPLTFIVVID